TGVQTCALPICGFQEAAVLLRLNQGKQGSQHLRTGADEANLDRITETDPRRVNIDLHGSRMSGLRVKLDIWKAAAADDQGVALLERFLGRRRPQQTNPPGCVRTIVGNDRLAQQRLDDRAGDLFGELKDFRAWTQAAMAGQDGDLRSSVDDLGRFMERSGR